MTAIALVVEIQTQPGQRDALLARLRKHRDNVLAHEPGCLGFDILLAEDDADTLMLYELYRDDQALTDHDSAPYFQAYREATASMVAARRRILCRPANE